MSVRNDPMDEDFMLEAEPWSDPYTPGKLAGVALAGALGSLLLYAAYVQLDPSSRERLKSGLLAAVKGQLRRIGEEDEL